MLEMLGWLLLQCRPQGSKPAVDFYEKFVVQLLFVTFHHYVHYVRYNTQKKRGIKGMFGCYLSPPTSRITAFLSLASLKGCICSKIFLGNFQKYPFHGNLGKAPFKNILKKFSEIFWRPGQGDLEKDDGHSSAKAPSRLLTCAFIFVMEKMSQFYDTWTSGQSK